VSTPSTDKRWYWLLLIPFVAIFAIPFYNTVEPTLFGMPFFYWYQLLCVVLTSPIVAFVFKRSHNAPKR
jgi:hypothetical protein